MGLSGAVILLAVGNIVGSTVMFPSSTGDVVRDTETQSLEQVAPRQVQPVPFDATRFDSLTATQLGAIFDSAAARGLPTRPLIDRALEGAARRIAGSKIVSVVRTHAAAMSDAREALGAASTAAELTAGASALRGGVDTRTLIAVRASRPTGSVEVPLVVLTDIVSRGVPSTTARDAVSTLAKLPKSDEALMGLQLTVAKNSVRGPGMAVDALNRYVKGTVSGSAPPSTPATTGRTPTRPPPP
jgi:hypothetical protein